MKNLAFPTYIPTSYILYYGYDLNIQHPSQEIAMVSLFSIKSTFLSEVSEVLHNLSSATLPVSVLVSLICPTLQQHKEQSYRLWPLPLTDFSLQVYLSFLLLHWYKICPLPIYLDMSMHACTHTYTHTHTHTPLPLSEFRKILLIV